MPLNCVAYGCQKKNGKSRNPSDENVCICGNHFVKGTFSPQK